MIVFLKKIQRTEFIQKYIYSCALLISFCMVLFSLISLLSYSSADASLFNKVLLDQPCNNWSGPWGANCAALLLFFFGGLGSLLVLCLCTFFLYYALYKDSVTLHYDRLGAFFSLLSSVTAMAYLHATDIIIPQAPGGLMGTFFYAMSTKLFDPFLLPFFFTTALVCSLILMLRLTGIIALVRFLRMVVYKISQIALLKYLGHYSCLVAHWCFTPFRWVHLKITTIFFGSDLTATCNEIITSELEETLHASTEDNDEEFWKSYTTQPSSSDHTPRDAEHAQRLFSDSQLTTHHTAMAHGNNDMLQEKKEKKKYIVPDVGLFKTENGVHQETRDNQKTLATILEEKLERFGIKGKVTSIKVGPVITLFEYQPDIDSKISKIIALEDDLALALQAVSIRIIAPIPGRSVVGFEVSNKERQMVLLGDVLQSADFKNFDGYLPLVLGQDSVGSTVIVDLANMPHLLVAGSTGSGKSVALNSMLVSLLCKHTPASLKLILIDPKRLEFASYADIPHLLVPIVTDPRKAALVLKWVVKTMEKRYELMQEANVRNIFDYHHIAHDTGREPMPFIIVMIDELSDLMMTAPKETEDLIARITQMARAAGIHMVVATQRPSVDVITGLIKVNFPSRISFRVTSKIDSRTILDCNGADKLLGKGDMLFLDSSSRLKRAHGAYVSDKEIEKLVVHIRQQQPVAYIDPAQDFITQVQEDEEVDDHLYHEVLCFIRTLDEVSISLLQRKFRIGYNRSARIIDKLESQGIIMQEPGGKTRKVIR